MTSVKDLPFLVANLVTPLYPFIYNKGPFSIDKNI